MKLRTMAVIALGVGALAVGCKKKGKENTADKAPSSGTMMGTGAGPGTGGTMAGTGAGSAPAPAKEAKLEGKGLADRYVECVNHINDHKWDDFKSKCLATEFKMHEVDGRTLDAGVAVDELKGQYAAFPDMKMQPQLILINGRNILAVALITGTHTAVLKSPQGDVPPTNKKIGQLIFHRIAINDENRGTEEWFYFDPGTMFGQLGLRPKEVPPRRPALDKGWDGAPIVVVGADDDKQKRNVDTVQKANTAFVGRKPAELMAFYADDALESDQAGEKDAKGKQEIEAGAMTFLKAFPDLKLETAHSFAAGDYVAILGTFSGTNDGPLGKMPPTKKKVSGQYAEIFKIKDGKLAEVWRFRNGVSMATQLGLMPTPGADGGAGSGSAAAPPKSDKPAETKKGG